MDPRNSEKTLRRLSRYARCLRHALRDGEDVVTSDYLSRPCGVSSVSVRKDLSAFGGFGKQGSGYDAACLLESIEKVLGTADAPPLILVGAGSIGRALMKSGIPGENYSIEAAFDTDDKLAGRGGVLGMDRLADEVARLGDPIAVVAVTAGKAQDAVDSLLEAGCRCILSYNLEPLCVPEGVLLRYTEMPTELDMLTHDLSKLRSETE